MARPGGPIKIAVKGTTVADVITVGDTGVTVNGAFTAYSAAQIDAGFRISGIGGNDVLTGGRGADEMDGGLGNDRLTGGTGYDLLTGGDGNDILSDVVLGATFDGGAGIDTLQLASSTRGAFVDILGGYVDDSISLAIVNGHEILGSLDIVDATVFGIEIVTGSRYNDVLWGNNVANTLKGGKGIDELRGKGGNDNLVGGPGADFLYGSEGNDRLTGGTEADTFIFTSGVVTAGDGNDVIADYEVGRDVIAFQWSLNDLSWAPTIYNGVASVVGTYDGGRSTVIVVGVTDSSDLTILHSDHNWDDVA